MELVPGLGYHPGLRLIFSVGVRGRNGMDWKGMEHWNRTVAVQTSPSDRPTPPPFRRRDTKDAGLFQNAIWGHFFLVLNLTGKQDTGFCQCAGMYSHEGTGVCGHR